MKGEIKITGARENNLKDVSVSIPWHSFTVVTGLSGSGKSSLALDTLYAEGLRRYMECLSTYARQFLERVDRPDMDDISGLPPAVAIESRNSVRNSRSTVGTTTEIYDYMRLLFAKVGRTFCPGCGVEVRRRSPEDIAEELVSRFDGKRALITFPPGSSTLTPKELMAAGFTRVVADGEVLEVEGLETIPSGAEVLQDRVSLGKKSFSRIVESLEHALDEGKYVHVRIVDGETLRFSKELECTSCGRRFNDPSPLLFSFNSPQGACPACKGFGNILGLDADLVVPDPSKSLAQGAIEPLTKPSLKNEMRRLLKFAEERGVYTNKPYEKLTEDDKRILFEGGSGFSGVKGVFRHLEEKNYKMHVRVFLSKYRSPFTCEECGGSRLVEEALWVRIADRNIAELSELSIGELAEFFEDLALTEYEIAVSTEILKQIRSRLDFLNKVGLEYLTLSRLTRTLSGGEAQRVNLACQLGAALTETLYIMDEPSIGLHPRDVDRLVELIKELRDRDNTVVVVEHDFEMIREADNIIELGPLAGERGGEIVYQGSVRNLLGKKADSLTRKYMTGEARIEVPQKRRKGSGKSLTLSGVRENNLKNITVSIPLRMFVCVSGVSGSGKSSLVSDVLYSALARRFDGSVERVGRFGEITGVENISGVVMLDQAPIGRSSRSNPVTYIKAYDEIRKVMAGTWDARSKGLTPSHFSFNVPGGRCEACEGAGVQQIEMHFLADVFVTCEECEGKRFHKDVLSVRYRNRNIDEILSLTVSEAINFFYEVPSLGRRLKVLQDVGLGYLRLGQAAPTLSGGEAQRMKIARELSGKGGKDLLYILDEPTVGLHAEDVKKLLDVINRLVLAGNTVLVVEHNIDVIKSADYVIDLGPEAGDAGGYVVASGTPEEVARVKKSYTAKYLKQALSA